MKWKKIGHIFDPGEHKLAEDYFGYAQSPQTLEFDYYIRVFFSTRKRTDDGKFLSVVQYADFTKDFKKILNTSDHEVLELGKTGTFDEHGIFPINIYKHQNRILGYTTGWTRRTAVSVDTGIGFVESMDGGKTFERLGDGPVLTSSLNEPFLVCDGFVKHYSGKFHMYYIYGNSWKVFKEGEDPDRTYVVAHAVSDDGINWIKEGKPIIEQQYGDECQALPTVIELNGRYHMYFCHRRSYDFRKNPKHGYRLGYAYSDDLVNWHRDDIIGGITTTDGSWDSDMMCYPHIFKCEGKVFLLYNGNEFGRYGFGLAELESAE